MKPDELHIWMQRKLDGETLPPEIEARLAERPDAEAFQADMQRALKRLDRIHVPPPPPDLVDGVMAFIDEREQAAVASAPAPEPILQSLWRTIQRYTPDFSVPTVIRREAWTLAMAGLVIAWCGWLKPEVDSGRAQAAIEPYAAEMEQFAYRVHQTGAEAVDRLNRLVEPLVGPGEEGQSPQSKADETPQGRAVAQGRLTPAAMHLNEFLRAV